MADGAEENNPVVLVKRFSIRVADSVDEVGAGGTLRTLIADDFRGANCEEVQWQKYFEPWKPTSANDEVQRLLHERAEELSKRWKRFREKVPDDARVQAWARRAPSLNDVKQTMLDVEAQWDQKRKSGVVGRMGIQYRRACVFIKDHETMLKIIPEGNEYVSLFSGVLKSVVFATARYEEVSTGLSKLIADISQDVAMCVKARQIYSTADITSLIMILYGLMFKFLTDVLDWYLEKWYKKLLKSFRESLYDDFKDQIGDMQRCVQSIKDQLALGTSAEIRSVRLTAEKTQQLQEEAKRMLQLFRNENTMLREENRRFREMQERKALTSDEELFRRNSELKLEVGLMIRDTLQEHAGNYLLEHSRRTTRVLTTAPRAVLPAAETTSRMNAGDRFNREDLLISSAGLEEYFDRDQVRMPWNSDLAALPTESTTRLQQWIMSKDSAILALASTDAYRPLTDVAAGVIELIDHARMPVISYFCTLDREASTGNDETRETRAVTSLVYALIRQALELAPAVFSSTSDFSAGRFEPLDGGVGMFHEALDLLRDGMDQAPPALYCVIDGLQWLDDWSTEQLLDSFVRTLQAFKEESRSLGITFKVLFTTAGPARSLLKSSLERQESFTVEGALQPLSM